MDNNSYRSQYIQSEIKKDSLSEASASVVESFWGRVAKAEEALGKTMEDGYSKGDYVDLFEKLNMTNQSTFYGTKSRISSYLKWLNNAGLLEQVYIDNLSTIDYSSLRHDSTYSLKYFKDFKSLQDAIESTLWAADKIDDGVYAMQISAIYLAWCGLQLEEALAIKKSDIYDDHIVARDKEIYPNSTIMGYIKDYRDAEGFTTKNRGIVMRKYVPSEWLFRTIKSDRIGSPKSARIYIADFGKSSGEDVNIFNYDKIYWSGVFNRAYQYEIANGEIRSGDVATMEKLFNEKYPSGSAANERLREYQSFKQYFFLLSQKRN